MKNKFSLGLVSGIDETKRDYIKTDDWRFLMNYFRKRGEVYLFDWKDVLEGRNLKKYLYGNPEGIELKNNFLNLDDSVNIIHSGQLGPIYNKQSDFLNYLNYMENFSGKIFNPIDSVRKNLSKRYLIDFQEKGLSVVPTFEVPSDINNRKSLESLATLNFGEVKDFVLKPLNFGEQGKSVKRLSEFQEDPSLMDFLSSGNYIIQPMVENIFSKGENSYIFVGKDFSHSLNKFTGKFKINFSNGAKYRQIKPEKRELDLCFSAIDSWEDKIHYARIDIIPGDVPLISEFEVVNPAAYLTETGQGNNYSNKLNKEMERALG